MGRINIWAGRLYASTRREDGQAMPEYALILALIAAVVLVALTTLSGGITGLFTQLTSKL